MISSFRCDRVDIDVPVASDLRNEFRTLFEGTDVRHEALELMWNKRPTLCDVAADTCIDWRYIGRRRHHRYRRRSTKFGLNVEASEWVVIVGFGA